MNKIEIEKSLVPLQFSEVIDELFLELYAEIDGDYNKPEWAADTQFSTRNQIKKLFLKTYGERINRYTWKEFYNIFSKEYITLLPKLYKAQYILITSKYSEMLKSTESTDETISTGGRSVADETHQSKGKSSLIDAFNISSVNRSDLLSRAIYLEQNSLFNAIRGFIGEFRNLFIQDVTTENYYKGGGIFTPYTFSEFIKTTTINNKTIYELLTNPANVGLSFVSYSDDIRVFDYIQWWNKNAGNAIVMEGDFKLITSLVEIDATAIFTADSISYSFYNSRYEYKIDTSGTSLDTNMKLTITPYVYIDDTELLNLANKINNI